MRFIRIIVFAMAALVCALAPARAEKRAAPVIGNTSYASLPSNEQLLKAVHDARTVGGALESIGFDVIADENLGRSALPCRFDAPMQRLDPGDAAFFFSGLQSGEVGRHRLEVVLRGGGHEVRHAGIVAAGAGAEIQHGPGEIIDVLAGQTRLGALAPVAVLMAAGASDRRIGLRRACRDRGGSAGLAQIGPRLLREMERDRQHVVAGQILGDRPHDVALAGAALEVAQLQIKIALVLAPDHRPRLVGGDAVLAMTRGAGLHLVRDGLRAGRDG